MATKLTYDAPTQNVDGSPLIPTAILKYEVGYGTVTGIYTTIQPDVDFTAEADGKQVTLIPTNIPYGVKQFSAVRAYSAAGASAWSNEVSFTQVAPVPKAPSNFSVA